MLFLLCQNVQRVLSGPALSLLASGLLREFRSSLHVSTSDSSRLHIVPRFPTHGNRQLPPPAAPATLGFPEPEPRAHCAPKHYILDHCRP